MHTHAKYMYDMHILTHNVYFFLQFHYVLETQANGIGSLPLQFLPRKSSPFC